MTDFFASVDNPDVWFYQMASRRAVLFVALTDAACKIYEVPRPVIECPDGIYLIHPEPFCTLVESAIVYPINMLYVWASYATGFYELFRGHRYEWLWGGGINLPEQQNQLIPINVHTLADGPNSSEIKGTFGPHWMKR